MVSAPPPGWYPDGNGATRYWDGAKWTEQTRDSQSGLLPPVQQYVAPGAGGSSYSSTPSGPPPSSAASGTAVRPTGTGARARGRWVLLAIVVLLAVVAGALAIVRPWADDETAGDSPPAQGSTEPTEDPTGDASPGGPETEHVQGDLDGDGFGDAVLFHIPSSNARDRNIRYTYASNGESFERTGIRLDRDEEILYADFNGDGVPGNVWWNTLSGDTLELKSSDGEIMSAEFPGFGLDPDEFWLVLAARDVDGDDDLDLTIIGQRAATKVTVWVSTNDGSGTMREPEIWATIPNANGYTSRILGGDVDDDGRQDLIVQTPAKKLRDPYSYTGDYDLTVYRSTGETFAPGDAIRDDYFDTSTDPTVLSGIDLGDGRVTFVVLDHLGKKIKTRLVEWTDDGFDEVEGWRSTVPAAGAQVVDTTTSDVDGDGDSDLVLVEEVPGEGAFEGTTYSPVRVMISDDGWTAEEWGPALPCKAETCVAYFHNID